MNSAPCSLGKAPMESCLCFPAAVGFLAVSSVITMSAPFFLGKIIDVIYTDPSADCSSSLTRLCLALGGVFLCGAAANAVRVYFMQTSGAGTLLLGGLGGAGLLGSLCSGPEGRASPSLEIMVGKGLCSPLLARH